MSYQDRLRAARRMKLRPNPSLPFHRQLARKHVIHADVFASIHPEYPAACLFVAEFRIGGIEPVIKRVRVVAAIGTTTEPQQCGRAWRLYDDSHRVRFNDRPHYAIHDWARAYHHTFILPWINGITHVPQGPFTHRSMLFHYFGVYDYPAFPNDFVNLYHKGIGKGRRIAAKPKPDTEDIDPDSLF